jgi:hypothetical protein
VKDSTLVELALDSRRYPDRQSVMELLARIRALGKVEWVAIAIGGGGGGNIRFVLHDSPPECEVRRDLAELVGEGGITKITARAAPPA